MKQQATTSSEIEIGRDEIIGRLRRHESELRGLGLTAVSIFGSRARGDARRDSDLDLLIEYDRTRKFSLVDLVHAEHLLTELIGRPVQITTQSSVPLADRPRIQQESEPVF